MNVGIVFRLVVSLMVLATFLLVGSVLAVASFRTLQQDFSDVAERQLPGLVAAGRLAQQSENLVAQAPSLIVSETNFARESVALRIADQAAWTADLIDELRIIGASEADLRRLHSLKDDLVGNLTGLAAAAQRQVVAERAGEALNGQLDRLTAGLNETENRLLNASDDAVSQLLHGIEGEDGAAGRPVARDLAALNAEAITIRRVVRRLREATHSLHEALSTERPPQLTARREAYDRQMAEVEALLDKLPADNAATLMQAVRQLTTLGVNAFAVRGDYLAANSAVRGLLSRNTVISDKLVGAVANITSGITKDVQDTNRSITRTTQERSRILYTGAGLSGLGALAILIYLKRAVLDRLRRLQGCLREQADRDVLEPLCSGQDEIAQMARSLSYYMEAISKREDALRQSETRYRTLYHRTPVMLHSADASGRLISVSDYWLECMGYSRDEVIGRRVVDFLTPECRQVAIDTLIPRLHATGQLKNVELRGIRRSGDEFDVLLSSIIELDEAGSFVQSLTVLTDITNQKQVAAELAAKTVELERSNAELEQFAYVASHDLREPLRMIGGYVGLLERRYADKLDGDAIEFIRYAADGAARMDRLVLDLLEYSRVGRKQQPLEPVPSKDVVERVLSDLSFTVTECGGTIQVPPDLPVVLADRPQLTRVFQNLIGNALKYRAPDRPPHLQLSVRRQDGDWLFRLDDNGIGIAPEDHERIFQLFQRLHARGEYDGTGLGLAIAKKIIERHGGRIWVESQAGEGSSFYFTLHAAELPARADA